MEIRSGFITPEQIQTELEFASEFLARHGIKRIKAFFGWGSEGPEDEIWKSYELDVSNLLEFAESGKEAKHFAPGSSDFYVEDTETKTVFQFCHESDVHLESSLDHLVDEVAQRWKTLGYGGYRKIGDEWLSLYE